jgi:hypothetical protein
MSFQPTDRIFSEGVYVFPLEHFTPFAALQSRIHEPWVRLLSSSMGRDNQLRYSASDCFETFPFPRSDPGAVISNLESIGDRLYGARARFMVDTGQGLTKTYNALKDPRCDDTRVTELRSLHEEMDRAVLAAYGWNDIAVPRYCPKSDSDRTAVQSFEDDVIDRLYALNEQRARDERRRGLAPKERRKAGDEDEAAGGGNTEEKPKKPETKMVSNPDQGKLFGS